MRVTLSISVILAIAAAGASVIVGKAEAHNMLLWLPAVMAAIPLLVPANATVCLIATVWLLVFVFLGGFSVGRFYTPAALAMLIATIWANTVVAQASRPSSGELRRAARLSVLISFGLVVATSVVWVFHMLTSHAFRWPAYAFIVCPVAVASVPVWRRQSESISTTAVLLAGIAFFPMTIEIGRWYSPAVIPLIYSAIVSARARRHA